MSESPIFVDRRQRPQWRDRRDEGQDSFLEQEFAAAVRTPGRRATDLQAA